MPEHKHRAKVCSSWWVSRQITQFQSRADTDIDIIKKKEVNHGAPTTTQLSPLPRVTVEERVVVAANIFKKVDLWTNSSRRQRRCQVCKSGLDWETTASSSLLCSLVGSSYITLFPHWLTYIAGSRTYTHTFKKRVAIIFTLPKKTGSACTDVLSAHEWISDPLMNENE